MAPGLGEADFLPLLVSLQGPEAAAFFSDFSSHEVSVFWPGSAGTSAWMGGIMLTQGRSTGPMLKAFMVLSVLSVW